jgi:hypothetical protein
LILGYILWGDASYSAGLGDVASVAPHEASDMPYLAPQFDYDVFMSYAHGQFPGVADPPLKPWSQALIDRLKADIASKPLYRIR